MKDFFEITETKSKKKESITHEKDWVKVILKKFNITNTDYRLNYKNNKVYIKIGNNQIISEEKQGKTHYSLYSLIPPLHRNPIKTIII
jgi:hypothetical protein